MEYFVKKKKNYGVQKKYSMEYSRKHNINSSMNKNMFAFKKTLTGQLRTNIKSLHY